MSQKIVIPKGTIDPDQTTVIQVPNHLTHSSVIVAVNPGSIPSEISYGGDTLPNIAGTPPYGGGTPPYAGGTPTSGSNGGAPSFNSSWGTPPSPITSSFGARRPCEKRVPLRGGQDSSWEQYNPPAASTPNNSSYMSKGCFMLTPPADACPTGNGKHHPSGALCVQKDVILLADAPIVADKMQILDQMDFVEEDQLMEDVRAFQKYRRRLTYDFVNMTQTEYYP